MPSCVAFGCHKRSDKGYKLFVFPRNKERRKQWEIKVRLKNWTATNNSYLCECHFEDDQFELHRADGKRKLKPNAVPSIFGDKRPKPKRKPPKVRRPPTPPADDPSRRHAIDHQYSKPTSMMPDEDEELRNVPFEFQCTDEEEEDPLRASIGVQDQDPNSMVVIDNIIPMENISVFGCEDANSGFVEDSNSRLSVSVASQSVSHKTYAKKGVNLKKRNDRIQVTVNATLTSADSSKVALESQLLKKITALENKLQQAKRQIATLYRDKITSAKRIQELSESVKVFLNDDQIQSLSHKGPRGLKWSSSTIMKAFQLRFACGSTGYNLLLDQKQPLPSLRTLRRRMKDMTFDSGIQYEVFTLVKVKADAMKAEDKLCTVTLGEMDLSAGVEDPEETASATGWVTLPDHCGVATHGLVIMLAGVRKCWKQTVAYFFTGDTAAGAILQRIVEEIIELAGKCGLHVLAVTSDVGSASQALWHSFGIGVDESNTLVNKIIHPSDDAKYLYFIPDPLHLLKRLKEELHSQSLILPDHIVMENNLPSSVVSIEPLEELAGLRLGSDMEILPDSTLKGKDVNLCENNNIGSWFFSLSDVAGLQSLAPQQGQDKSFQTLAWFIKSCNKWYTLLSRRHPASVSNHAKKDKYATTALFLKSFIDLFSTLNFEEDDGCWKLIQIGVLLATQSILDIQDESLDGNVNYLPASRFTQDCLETLFSSLRSKSPIPTPLEFINGLRGISVVQYLGAAH